LLSIFEKPFFVCVEKEREKKKTEVQKFSSSSRPQLLFPFFLFPFFLMAFAPPSLSTFFIFTPKNVPEGKEHEKILFFHPSSLSEGEKNNQIGLSEALVNFTGYFCFLWPIFFFSLLFGSSAILSL
jgi:hypothetical protein